MTMHLNLGMVDGKWNEVGIGCVYDGDDDDEDDAECSLRDLRLGLKPYDIDQLDGDDDDGNDLGDGDHGHCYDHRTHTEILHCR